MKQLTVWRFTKNHGVRWCLEFKPEDLWIGAFWRMRDEVAWLVTDLWICVLPCLPLHFEIMIRRDGEPS